MMDNIFLAAAILAGFHSYTFSRWLWRNKNRTGAVGVLLLILICLALPVFRIMNRG